MAVDPKSLENLAPRFEPGQSGNPGGKTGPRRKLEARALEDLEAVWRAGGKAALEKLIVEKPEHVLRAVVSLLPKEVKHTEDGVTADRARRLLELVDRRLDELAGAPGERTRDGSEVRVSN